MITMVFQKVYGQITHENYTKQQNKYDTNWIISLSDLVGLFSSWESFYNGVDGISP